MTKKISDLEKRMRNYETKERLIANLPIILRIDGSAFHTFCRGMDKPFDDTLIEMMNQTALYLCNMIQNCKMAYIQSDEINFLVYATGDATPWFDNVKQKICSVTASHAGAFASLWCKDNIPKKAGRIVAFDTRVFALPDHELINYFIWRQQDWERNSVQMLARSLYSHKQLHGKSRSDMHEMIHDKGMNWNDLSIHYKRGRSAVKTKISMHVKNDHFEGHIERSKWTIDYQIPIFTEYREYIPNQLSNDVIID